MGGPKHLWSGDWQRESEAATARLRPQAAETPPADPDRPAGPSGRRRRVRMARLGVLGLVVLGGVAWGLTALLGSSGHRDPSAVASTPRTQTIPRTQTTPQFRHRGATPTSPQVTPTPTVPGIPTVPQPTPSPAPGVPAPTSPAPQPAPTTSVGPTVNWLGMQINTLSPGVVVIDTVALGSPADRSGLEPGEDIVSVAGRPLRSATDIAAAIRGLPAGRSVPVEISYGSSVPQQVQLRLGAAPVTSP